MTDLLHPCLNCGKHLGTHSYNGHQCPRGMKTRIGYVSFGPGVFEPLPGWTAKEGLFKI